MCDYCNCVQMWEDRSKLAEAPANPVDELVSRQAPVSVEEDLIALRSKLRMVSSKDLTMPVQLILYDILTLLERIDAKVSL